MIIEKELIEELRNGVKIMSIEARYLYSENKDNPVDGYSTLLKRNLYTVKIPYSLGLEKIYKTYPDEFKEDKSIERYTDMIINVSFKGAAKTVKKPKLNKDGTERKVSPKYVIKTYGTGKNQVASIKKVSRLTIEMNTGRLRAYLYEHGFVLNGNKYVFFMRSTSKSRGGNMLFIKEQYVNEFLIDWARLGISFSEDTEIDIAGIKSYESLILSGICGKLEIKPTEILLIKDYDSIFSCRASATKLNENNRLIVRDEEVEYHNSIWDGMSLMDTSKYNEVIEFSDMENTDSLRGKSFVLLRNLWFKSAAFNFDIQKYFLDYNVTIEDLKKHGWTIAENVTDIKLITTPNSLKILKIKELVDNKYPDDLDGQIRSMFEYWLYYIQKNSYFGVVKSEHGTKDHARRCNSQFLMALPLSKDEIEELLESYEFPHMEKMRNNDDEFLKHLGDRKNSDNSMIYELGLRVPKFCRTELFAKFKNDTLNDYKESWKRDGIKIPASDFCVCVSNPFEMIQYATGKEFTSLERIHKGREAYCQFYEDGQKLFAARNPCVSSGNIICLKNTKNELLLKYMRLSNNIVVVNSIDSDIMERASSMDYDSDQMYLSSNELLVKKAEYCEEHFLTPVNKVEKLKSHKHYTVEDLSKTDSQIAKGKIGDIVNIGQILQAYYWQVYFSNIEDERLKEHVLQSLYDKISMLSSASGVEIDRAKREFLMNTEQELKDLRQLGLIKNNDSFLSQYIEHGILTNARKKTITQKELDEKYPEVLTLYKQLEVYQQKKMDEGLSEKEKVELKNLEDRISKFLLKDHKKDVTKLNPKIKKPLYFKFAFPNSEENSLYFENGMNCPMDNLCVLVDDKTPKKAKKEKIIKDVTELMNRYDKRPNDDHIRKVKVISKEYSKFCTSRMFQKQNKQNNIRDITKKEYFQSCVKEIEKIKLNNATIVAIFNACYGSKQAREHNKDISKYRKHLIDLVYAAHSRKVLDCFNEENKNS